MRCAFPRKFPENTVLEGRLTGYGRLFKISSYHHFPMPLHLILTDRLNLIIPQLPRTRQWRLQRRIPVLQRGAAADVQRPRP